MPNIKSRFLCEGVTEIVVPGQTWTSPPWGRRRIVVSDPAVTVEPFSSRLAAIAVPLDAPLTGTTTALLVKENPDAFWESAAGAFPTVAASGGFNRPSSRLPAPSQECP